MRIERTETGYAVVDETGRVIERHRFYAALPAELRYAATAVILAERRRPEAAA